MVEVATQSRGMMEDMFGTEARLAPELNFLLLTFMMGVEDINNMAVQLPSKFSAEVGRYSQTVLDAISKITSASEEKEAAGFLTESFGVPKFFGAVGVFNLLVENLLDAEEIVQLSVQEAETALQNFRRHIYKIAVMVFDDEVKQLELRAMEEGKAANEFSAEVEIDNRAGIRNVVATAKKGFREGVLKYGKKAQALKQKREEWFRFIDGLFSTNYKTKAVTEKKYEIDPAMAL